MPTESSFDSRDFDTYAEYRLAVLGLLRAATQSIAWFDPDLRETGIESPQCIAALAQFCNRSTARDNVRLAVHSAAFIQRDCPRLLDLVSRLGHCVSIRIATPQFQNWQQPFLVVDDVHVVTRFHQDRPRGKLCIDDLGTATPLLTQFETIWLHAQPGPTGAALGI